MKSTAKFIIFFGIFSLLLLLAIDLLLIVDQRMNGAHLSCPCEQVFDWERTEMVFGTPVLWEKFFGPVVEQKPCSPYAGLCINKGFYLALDIVILLVIIPLVVLIEFFRKRKSSVPAGT